MFKAIRNSIASGLTRAAASISPASERAAVAAGATVYPAALNPSGESGVPAPAFPVGPQAGAQAPDLIRSVSQFSGVNAMDRLNKLNRWREYWDPLPWLTPKFAREIQHASQLGLWADLQWVYWFVEQSDGLLAALLQRRLSAIGKLEWQSVPLEKKNLPRGCSEAEAQEQADCLGQAYDRIDNLGDALEFLALADFRKFSHLEIILDDCDQPCSLSPVEQWHFKRRSMHSPWIYDPASFQSWAGEPIDPSRFVIREVMWPIHRVALPYFLLTHSGQERWREYADIYAVPGWLIIGPPNVPKEYEQTYQEQAEIIARGGTGYMPNGSDAKAHDGPRQSQPYQELLLHWERKITLAATGGLLGSLAMSGTGTLAGNAHQETFDALAKSNGVKIAECLDRQLSAQIIAANFKGRPKLASFRLGMDEFSDPAAVNEISQMETAGLQIDPDQITERTGWKVTRAIQDPPPGDPSLSSAKSPKSPKSLSQNGHAPDTNRANLNGGPPQGDYLAAQAEDLAPIRRDLARIAAMTDPAAQRRALELFTAHLPQALIDLGREPHAADALLIEMQDAFGRAAKEEAVQ